MVGAAFGLYSTARQDAAARANAALTAMEVRAATERAERMLNELNETRIELQPSTNANEELRAALEKNGTQTNPPNPSLESALVSTPEKALAVPMLRQQIDTTQDRTRAGLDSVRGELGFPPSLYLESAILCLNAADTAGEKYEHCSPIRFIGGIFIAAGTLVGLAVVIFNFLVALAVLGLAGRSSPRLSLYIFDYFRFS